MTFVQSSLRQLRYRTGIIKVVYNMPFAISQGQLFAHLFLSLTIVMPKVDMRLEHHCLFGLALSLSGTQGGRTSRCGN